MQENEYSMADATKFLNLLHEGGSFTFQTFSDNKEERPVFPTIRHGQLEEHAEELKCLNAEGAGIFITVNETNGMGRKATDIVRVRAHFIDSDHEPIEEVCKRFPLKPHMTVETSEGKGHAYYLVSDSPLLKFKQIQERLIQALGTDPAVKDLSRTMRVPGFFHMKGEPRLVKLVHIEEGIPRYSEEEILNALPPLDLTHNRKKTSSPQTGRADPSIPQSDGFRTATLTSLVGGLLAKRMDDEEIFKWLTTWNNNNIQPLEENKIWETVQSLRKSDQRNHPERYGQDLTYTDTGNARRLVGRFGGDIRFCHDRNEWLIWDGHRWVWDSTSEIVRKATDTATCIIGEAGHIINIAEMDKISRWTRQSLSASGINNMISLAKADNSVTMTSSRLDQSDWQLNVSNGTIDLKGILFRPHAREDMITKIAHVAYEPDAGCPTWIWFLGSIFNGDQELISWLQKVVGYTFTGSTNEQCVFFLIGDGCNGKSTFLMTLKAIMGDYAVQAHPESFMTNRYSSAGGARSDLMRLPGARMVTASEGEEGQRLAEAFIKQCTGGEEISTRGLYQKNQVEFTPKFKLFFCSNHKPRISGTDYGIWRRIRVIPFSVCIPEKERDPDLMDKFLLESSGILNWVLEGCLRWQGEGVKEIPSAVEIASRDYQGENDLIARFLAECCCEGEGKVHSSHLYRAYSEWSQGGGEDKLSTDVFSQYLTTKRGFRKDRNKQGIFWSGLKLLVNRDAIAEFT
jgi:P4 family phage/plasmid primase-like protien